MSFSKKIWLIPVTATAISTAQAKFTLLETPVESWFEANAACALAGYELASIHSQNELRVAQSLCSDHASADDLQGCWVGAVRDETQDTWKWMDGSSLAVNDASLWGIDEPNNEDGVEHCGHLFKKHNYQMNDIECTDSHPMPALCEMREKESVLNILSQEDIEEISGFELVSAGQSATSQLPCVSATSCI